MTFKFTYTPTPNETDMPTVALEGGNWESDISKVLDLFVLFMNGCGYLMDRERLSYRGYSPEEIAAMRKVTNKFENI